MDQENHSLSKKAETERNEDVAAAVRFLVHVHCVYMVSSIVVTAITLIWPVFTVDWWNVQVTVENSSKS